MMLLLSGEGKTDLGQMKSGPQGLEFEPGPMAWIIDKLLQAKSEINYSLLETHAAGGDCVRFIDETGLARYSRKGSTLLPGLKYGKGTGLFTRNAQCLGLKAIELAQESQSPVLAVLFRDADTSRSTPVSSWQEKVDSMIRGFQLVSFPSGVPMVPRPKSEAWLLCALRNNYQGCEVLEDAPGNDDSPNSLKKQLALWAGSEPSAQDQANWVKENRVDPNQIQMPSFKCFVASLDRALESL